VNDPRIAELRSLLPRAMLPDWVRIGARAVRLFKDRLHPDRHDAVFSRLIEQVHASVALREQRRLAVPAVSYPSALPITSRKDEIVAAIRANQVIVLAGETGSGKTTQIPKMCLEAGLGIEAKIGCTQPRRVAALSISKRIAEELGVGWGREVGCKIRFDDRSSSATYIKLMTDGILLAEAQGDPQLSEYNAIIIDEAHERSLNIDFLLGHLKNLLVERKDLKLIVTSATIDLQAFSKHFNDAPIIEVSGRMYPVEVIHAPFDHEPDSEEENAENFNRPAAKPFSPPRGEGLEATDSLEFSELSGSPLTPALAPDGGEGARIGASIRSRLRSSGGDLTYVDASVSATETILFSTHSGDVLIFLPGERDIRECADQLEGRFSGDAEIVPLFGRLSAGDQQRVFAPSHRRKIVIATNIAETSLTIPGIRYVIDAGLARISRYSPRTRTRRLPIEPVSQSSANQRKGRSGRVEDGVCIRLYSEEDFKARPAFTQPEIQRSNLAEVILRMKAFRFGDIETFPFLQPPTPAAIATGYALLQELGALDAKRDLTQLGRDLARLPIDPTLGRMLLQAQGEGANRELLIIASGLSIQDPRERPMDQKDAANAAHKRFADPGSDFLSLLNIWNAVHEQWEALRTQGARRKFCKQHFLSYLRMREWQDLHSQLEGALKDTVGRASLPGRSGRTAAPAEPPVGRTNDGSAATATPGRSGVANEAVFMASSHPDGSAATVALPQEADRTRQRRKPTGEELYDAIHRSILAGLIGHVARREERNAYKGSGNRLLTVFPGSALYERGEPKKKTAHDRRQREDVAEKEKTRQPAWIVAGEIVETSQLFARTLAGIDPQWIAQIAPHCCRVTHQNPHWSAAAGRVMVEEISTLHGLEVARRKVAYANINPADATKIFLRSALVEGDLFPPIRSRRGDDADLPSPGLSATLSPSDGERDGVRDSSQYPFLAHNRGIRQKIENWQTRVRRYELGDLDQAMVGFYAARIADAVVASRDELNRWLREAGRADSLRATEADLIGDLKLDFDTEAFPDAIRVHEIALPLRYAYAPGEEWDGVTIQLPAEIAASMSPAALEWAVPGLRSEQALELLRSLPKTLRRELMPLQERAAEIALEFQPSGPSLKEDLGRFVHRRYSIEIPPSSWSAEAIPAHLRPRVEIVDHRRKPIAVGRDLEALKDKLVNVPQKPAAPSNAWRLVTERWERPAVGGWTFGDLPERIEVTGDASGAMTAWPGLQVEDKTVGVRLFRTAEAARQAGASGLPRLIELALQKDLAWVQKDLRTFSKFSAAYAPLGSSDDLQESAFAHIRRLVMPKAPLPALTKAAFDTAVEQTREQLRGAVQRLAERLGPILQLRQQIVERLGGAIPPSLVKAPIKSLDALTLFSAKPAAPKATTTAATNPLANELFALLPPRFLETIPSERLPQLPRYLKALLLRIERAAGNPPKEQERANQVAPYVAARKQLAATPPKSDEGRALAEEFRWMVEEFKVSLFAQELGTAQPVSPKRLDEHLERLRMTR
jgi:ATP-dependent helicase HrpA